jgi:hypothetical protein
MTESNQKNLMAWWLNEYAPETMKLSWGELRKKWDQDWNEWRLEVSFWVEEKTEWRYLLQHLPDDPLGSLVKECKKALFYDLGARLVMMEMIRDKVLTITNLPFVVEFPKGRLWPGVNLELISMIYMVYFSEALEIPCTPIDTELFSTGSLVSYNQQVVMYDPDEKKLKPLLNLIVGIPFEDKSQGQRIQRNYLTAQKKIRKLKERVDQIRLALSFPEGSSCDACRSIVSGQKKVNV